MITMSTGKGKGRVGREKITELIIYRDRWGSWEGLCEVL